MSTFISYSTGNPLKTMTYSYTTTEMTETYGRRVVSYPITPNQFRELESMQADDWIRAASMFSEASRGGARF